MAAARKKATGKSLADRIAQRRGKRYPAHAFIAEHFPDYMEVLLDLDYVIREKPRRFSEKMHELFHIIALAVEMSNPPNQPHLRKSDVQLPNAGSSPRFVTVASDSALATAARSSKLQPRRPRAR